MSQNSFTSGWSERDREEDHSDDGLACEETYKRGARMDFSPIPNWPVDEYRHECVGLMNVKCFDSIAVECQNLSIYDRTRFKRDTVLGPWKER